MDPSKNYTQTHHRSTEVSEYGVVSQRIDAKEFKGHDNLTWQNHMGISQVEKQLGKEKCDEYLKFCVIRNPYDKMVSFYHHTMRITGRDIPFDKWCLIRGNHCRNMYRHVIDNKIKMDYYIRFEHMKEDIEKLCKKLDIDFDANNIPSYKSGIRPKKHYREYYKNEKVKQIVYLKHKNEFDKYKYEF